MLLTLLSPQSAPPVVAVRFWLRVAGVWKETTVYIKIDSVWKAATPSIKVSGVWK
jgi:hypothetical protein